MIRLCLGLLVPSSGAVSLFGAPPSRATRLRVGYVPQSLGLYDDLTVVENWEFVTAAFGRRRLPLPDTLSTWAHDLVGNLPLGLQRRIAFAAAFSHDPDLLVLDEPTSGVGPLGRARLWDDIRHSVGPGNRGPRHHAQHGGGGAVRPDGGHGGGR